MTQTEERAAWVQWLATYSPERFYDAFMRVAQGAESRCVHCGAVIRLDIREGGGIADWADDGDYGCWASPDSDEDGVGGHVAEGTQ